VRFGSGSKSAGGCRPGFNTSDPRVRIDVDGLHRRQVDQDATRSGSTAGQAVPPAADRDLKTGARRLGWGVDFVACYFQRVDAWLASWSPGRSAGRGWRSPAPAAGLTAKAVFGPAREVPARAGPAGQVAAFLGRAV
jgi:hypothetical protein